MDLTLFVVNKRETLGKIILPENKDEKSLLNPGVQENDDKSTQSLVSASYKKIDRYLAHCLVKECCSSLTFMKSFCHYAEYKWKRRYVHVTSKKTKSESVIILDLVVPRKDVIDFKWDVRMTELVRKKLLLDDAMNWLNTLGGGYSALGDYFVEHAEEAGKISLRQLGIALEMGDPPTVMRCHLYWAMSLMQQGYTRRAKHIIRNQYSEACQLAVRDMRLEAMCQGIWSRLRYLRSQQRRRKRRPSS